MGYNHRERKKVKERRKDLFIREEEREAQS
jgi:hypothetical protein